MKATFLVKGERARRARAWLSNGSGSFIVEHIPKEEGAFPRILQDHDAETSTIELP